jgi:hypothetical protein
MEQQVNFEIDSINIYGNWKYNSVNNICGVCENSLYDAPPSRNNKIKIIVSTHVVMGECFHAFHRTCIKKYILKNTTCPLCVPERQYIFKQNLEDVSNVKLFNN